MITLEGVNWCTIDKNREEKEDQAASRFACRRESQSIWRSLSLIESKLACRYSQIFLEGNLAEDLEKDWEGREMYEMLELWSEEPTR